MAFLEVYLPDGKIEHFELTKSSMTIGRSAEADITIQLPVMSRIHARIEKNGKNRWVVTDLESRNKTLVNHQAVKSHALTHKDVFYFGSIKVVFQDPSGASNEKASHTVPLKAKKTEAESEAAPAEGNSCPRCKAQMPDHAIVCMTCGYNTKTGKSLSLQVEGKGAKGSGETVPGTTAISTPKKSAPATKVIQEKPELFMDWVLPAALFVISVIIMAAVTGKAMTISQTVGAAIRAAILCVVSIFIAPKIGTFGHMGFANAIVKFISVAMVLSAISAVSMKKEWSLIFSSIIFLAAMLCLLILFFNTDMIAGVVIVVIVVALNYFINSMLVSTLFTSFGGTLGSVQNIPLGSG